MRTETVSRVYLAELLSGSRSRRSHEVAQTELFDSDDKRSIEVVWATTDHELQDLPVAIVTPSESKFDLVAWIATHLGAIRPMTSYVRIVTQQEFRALRDMEGLRPSLARLEKACIGLVLGEAFAHTQGRIDPDSLSVNACTSTFASIAARLCSMNRSVEIPQVLADWQEVSTLTRSERKQLTPEELLLPWSILTGTNFERPGWSGRMPKRKLNEVHELIVNPRLRVETLARTLLGRSSSSSVVQDMMSATREQRVKLFEEFSRSIDGPPRDLDSIVLGLLASLISPGTLNHIEFVGSVLNRHPAGLLWYGVFAGLHDESRVLEAGGGLGLRVLRELLRSGSLCDRPTADIGFLEFAVLSRGFADSLSLRTQTPGVMCIEIAPLVTATIKWHSTGERGKSQSVSASDRNALARLARKAYDANEAVRMELQQIAERLKIE